MNNIDIKETVPLDGTTQQTDTPALPSSESTAPEPEIV